MKIRSAYLTDSMALTEVSFDSKSYWNYPKSYFDIWSEELTIAKKYIKDNIVFVAELDEQIVAYYSIKYLSKDVEFKGSVLQTVIG